MNQQQTFLRLTPEVRDQLLTEYNNLLKEKMLLKQSLQKEKEQNQASSKQLFLECLEVFDALEFLLTHLTENPEVQAQFIKRLPKSLTSIQKKLVTTLEKRDVTLIEFNESKPDFSICRVVDSEIRNDLEEKTITKTVRQGFRVEENVLRPIEVIISKKSND